MIRLGLLCWCMGALMGALFVIGLMYALGWRAPEKPSLKFPTFETELVK